MKPYISRLWNPGDVLRYKLTGELVEFRKSRGLGYALVELRSGDQITVQTHLLRKEAEDDTHVGDQDGETQKD